jgi:hypothetical protein
MHLQDKKALITGGTTKPPGGSLLPDDEDVTVRQQRSELRAVDRLVVTAARRAPRVMRAVNRLDAARHRRRAGGSG